MSAKFKAVSALDDRVAKMSDLRVLIDEVSKLITLQQVQIDELRALVTPEVPHGTLSVENPGDISIRRQLWDGYYSSAYFGERMNWKDFGSRLLGAVVAGLMSGLGAKAQGGSWSSAGTTAGLTALTLVSYGATHTGVDAAQPQAPAK